MLKMINQLTNPIIIKFELMKKMLFTMFMGLTITFLASAQEEEEWIYKISHIVTEHCIDSVTCYSEILVELNMNFIPDSTVLILKIGDTPGGDNIYNRQLIKTDDIYSQADVLKDNTGNAVVSMGEYLVDEQFYVDMEIQANE